MQSGLSKDLSRDVSSSRDFAILGAILVLAAALRLVGLNGPLWYDELITVDTHLRLPFGEMLDRYEMNHHYLFSLQSKLSVMAFGEQPWAVRLPAFLFGLGGIAAIWVLARDLSCRHAGRRDAGRGIAHLTALLLALSFHHIWFSQNARGYTELAFFASLGMILWLRGMRDPRPGLWIAYGACLAAAIFTHLTGAFFFVAQGLVWLAVVATDVLRGRRDRVLWPALGYLAGGALTLALYAPLLPSLLSEVGGVSGSSAVDVMQEYQNPVWTVIEAVRTGIGNLGPLVGLVALAVLACIAMGLVAFHRRAPLFGPVVVVHIGLTMGLLLALGMRIWPRFFFADIGFLMLLILGGVQWASGLAARILPLSRGMIFGLAAAAMLLVSAGLAARNYTAPKQDMAGAYELVMDQAPPDAARYAAGVGANVYNGYFDADWPGIMDDAAYAAALAQPGPVWIVVAFPGRTFRVVPALARDAETGALELVRAFPGTLGDGAVLVYRRP